MLPLRMRLIQSVGELVIPLAGYFWWDWNLYFLLLFYLLDQLVLLGITYLKVKKIMQHQGGKFQFGLGAIALPLIVGVNAFLSIQISSISIEGFDLQQQSFAFLALEDMGIAQGWILLPLLIYMGWMQYKMTFLLPRRYQVESSTVVFKQASIPLLGMMAILASLFGLYFLWPWPELFAVLILALVNAALSFISKN